jgi:acyl dehydratase
MLPPRRCLASNKNKQESAMPGLYYEQFSVGQKFEHSVSRTVTEMDNMLFSCLTMNTQPLHIDAEFASHTEFGKPLVNSLFTLGLLIGMTVTETTLGTTIANLGLGDTQFPHPVFKGTHSARTPRCFRSEPADHVRVQGWSNLSTPL